MKMSKPRGRPRGFDESAALDAVMGAFWRHGYEGTSVATLEAATGLKAPSLYAAFGAKEQLYRAALDRYQDRHGIALAPDGPARDAVAHYLLAAADTFSDPDLPPGCMVSTAALGVSETRRDVAGVPAGLRAAALSAIRDRLEGARRDGELPADADVAALARVFGAVIQGMSVQAIDGATRRELRAMARQAMSLWPLP